MAAPTDTDALPARGFARWWVYQRERFPLFAHGPLIAAFSLSAVSYSAMLRGTSPSIASATVAFVTALLLFLQLRIADEFKDREDDARYRPYLPVPRGLVKLKELAVVGAFAAAVQLALALWLDVRLVALLLIVWAYFGLMSAEFFAKRWLSARPLLYMVSHMLIMPLIDLYATACDWLPAGGSSQFRPPAGLPWFLLVSLFNGFVVEIGRKTRAPADEEEGVTTYSGAWGPRRATCAWLSAMVAAAAFAALAARRIQFTAATLVLLIVLLLASSAVAASYLAGPTRRKAKTIELASGVWTLLSYLVLGAIPLVVRLLGRAGG